jgi:hypothetical protein
MSFLRLLFDAEYLARMDCAVKIRGHRKRRDAARAKCDACFAAFHHFSALVTRDLRLVTYTRSKFPSPVANPERGNATGQG